MRAYIDSDILIWHLRGERRATSMLRRLAKSAGIELWTGAMQRAEVVFFMRPEEEAATTSFLSRLQTQPINQEIVDLGGAFYRRWHASHAVDINDALLAATMATTGGKIISQNTRHYPMPDVVVQKGW